MTSVSITDAQRFCHIVEFSLLKGALNFGNAKGACALMKTLKQRVAETKSDNINMSKEELENVRVVHIVSLKDGRWSPDEFEKVLEPSWDTLNKLLSS